MLTVVVVAEQVAEQATVCSLGSVVSGIFPQCSLASVQLVEMTEQRAMW